MILDAYLQHDTTVAALLSALGGYDAIAPPYTAAVFIELWNSTKADDKNATYTVKFKYRNHPFGPKENQTVTLNVTGMCQSCEKEPNNILKSLALHLDLRVGWYFRFALCAHIVE